MDVILAEVVRRQALEPGLIQVGLPVLPLTSCMTSGSLRAVFEPQLASLSNCG